MTVATGCFGAVTSLSGIDLAVDVDAGGRLEIGSEGLASLGCEEGKLNAGACLAPGDDTLRSVSGFIGLGGSSTCGTCD